MFDRVLKVNPLSLKFLNWGLGVKFLTLAIIFAINIISLFQAFLNKYNLQHHPELLLHFDRVKIKIFFNYIDQLGRPFLQKGFWSIIKKQFISQIFGSVSLT